MKKYMLGIDQSTQGTKALLFNREGELIGRSDVLHRQLINDQGWVEHDPEEIFQNTLQAVKQVVLETQIDKEEIAAVGISNQRETAMAWKKDGTPAYNAIVWQCARAEEICNRLQVMGKADVVQRKTGLRLSPYFSAGKIAWLLENVEGLRKLADSGELFCGTMDCYLLYRLTNGASFFTDYSNASRTQLFNIFELQWDQEMCNIFNIPISCLPEVLDSDSEFGMTDFGGFLDTPIPIHGMLGDSHAALYGQGCVNRGMIKATYGTGSSVMMNIGDKPVFSKSGIVTSLAWKMKGIVNYVLEGNINYTGAVVSWLQKDVHLIDSSKETEQLAFQANPKDKTYLVPAFTGLGAPYWDSQAEGVLCGITRTTGKAEIVRAGLDCIAYQIDDIVSAMEADSQIPIQELRVDGGPTGNQYLMQFQSDILDIPVQVPSAEELSGIGAAYAAGVSVGFYQEEQLFEKMRRRRFDPALPEILRREKKDGWKKAVSMILTK